MSGGPDDPMILIEKSMSARGKVGPGKTASGGSFTRPLGQSGSEGDREGPAA